MPRYFVERPLSIQEGSIAIANLQRPCMDLPHRTAPSHYESFVLAFQFLFPPAVTPWTRRTDWTTTDEFCRIFWSFWKRHLSLDVRSWFGHRQVSLLISRFGVVPKALGRGRPLGAKRSLRSVWLVVSNVIMIRPPGSGRAVPVRTIADLAGSENIQAAHLAALTMCLAKALTLEQAVWASVGPLRAGH